jgi:hypothetical protein
MKVSVSAQEDIIKWRVDLIFKNFDGSGELRYPMSIAEAEALRRELDAALMSLEVEARR